MILIGSPHRVKSIGNRSDCEPSSIYFYLPTPLSKEHVLVFFVASYYLLDVEEYSVEAPSSVRLDGRSGKHLQTAHTNDENRPKHGTHYHYLDHYISVCWRN